MIKDESEHSPLRPHLQLSVKEKKWLVAVTNIFEWAYFKKRTRTRTRTFRKSGRQTFRKSGPCTKIDCRSQRLMFDKTKGADFKYDNSL